MARKTIKRRKTAKGRKSAKRAPKQAVLKLPVSFGRVVADAVALAIGSVANHAVEKVAAQAVVPSPAMPAPVQPAVRLANLGADQRFTKNIGNYESFSFGFSLNIPIEIAPDANVESAETRALLRPKYEATMGFLNEMLKEVGNEIDAARGAVPQ